MQFLHRQFYCLTKDNKNRMQINAYKQVQLIGDVCLTSDYGNVDPLITCNFNFCERESENKNTEIGNKK